MAMEVAGIPIFKFVGFILAIVAFVIDLIGFATPYWYFVEGSITKTYAGLWKYCYSSSIKTTCDDYIALDDLDSWFEAVQAMETLGFLTLIAAVAVIGLWLFVIKDKDILKWVAVGCLGGAAFFILVGVCIYAGESSEVAKENLHFSFAFVIIAALIAIGASVLFCVDKLNIL